MARMLRNQRRGSRVAATPSAAARIDSVLFLFVMNIFATKAVYLNEGEPYRLDSFFPIVALDAQIICLVGTLTILFWFFGGRLNFFHPFENIFLLLFCSVYFVDSLAIVTLDQRFHWSAIAFALEHRDALPEMIPWNRLGLLMAVLLFLCVITMLPLIVNASRYCAIPVVMVSLFLSIKEWILPGQIPSRFELSYKFDGQYLQWAFKDLWSDKSDSRVDIYSGLQIERGTGNIYRLRSPEIDAFPERVIVVLLESFSAVHSKKTSQLSDNAPWFDELAAGGTLFTNYLAAGLNTNYGVASMLTGVPAISAPGFPNNPYYIFNNYVKFSAPLEALKRGGYYLTFISGYKAKTATVKGDDLKKFGFNDVVFPPFNSSPEPTDEKSMLGGLDSDLYDVALQKLGVIGAGAKFLMILEPASGHSLWTERRDPKKVLEPMGRDLKQFVSALEEGRFFDNGLLIITSDQRWTAKVSKEESERYGDSAPFRIPLLLMGKGVAAGTVDRRFLHQSDLIVNLPKILNPDIVVTDSIISVGSYKNKIIDLFDLNLDSKAFTRIPLVLEGTSISLMNYNTIEINDVIDYLHSVRAAYQSIIPLESRSRLEENPPPVLVAHG